MRRSIGLITCFALLLFVGSVAFAQNDAAAPAPNDTAAAEPATPDTSNGVGAAIEKAGDVAKDAEGKVKEYAAKVDQSEKAQKISAGILQPIYDLAERFSFPAFHWIAFALMAMGVVSWSLQLVLGKLVVLARGGFSMSEIISDAVVLAISVVGLVLTTQAAAENSTFTQTSSSVLSAAGVGVFFGFILYWWGQRQELEAVKGRTKAATKKDE
ncbi:MAG: hypothetical protein GC159_13245 [Phycisphaera sp.]|nr:hypothetical protein [Phycisphaera sp.]